MESWNWMSSYMYVWWYVYPQPSCTNAKQCNELSVGTQWGSFETWSVLSPKICFAKQLIKWMSVNGLRGGSLEQHQVLFFCCTFSPSHAAFPWAGTTQKTPCNSLHNTLEPEMLCAPNRFTNNTSVKKDIFVRGYSNDGRIQQVPVWSIMICWTSHQTSNIAVIIDFGRVHKAISQKLPSNRNWSELIANGPVFGFKWVTLDKLLQIAHLSLASLLMNGFIYQQPHATYSVVYESVFASAF